ncbi:cyclin-D5-1-like protein [Cinnamomum micranthum f. kanehirae]|uniref:Cyclin-D5-1-like protein n=1 Tax=Cinnamomum micranthum f. kanehirae TaxID=337451 RepID=A0A3S3QDE4_9MAGN|nr:cyclin-D5-1-like protein [Cinnamomum micranthum f. kanehirae]
MEDSNCSVSLPSLLCNENDDCVCLDETREEEVEQEARFYSIDCKGLSETEDEYIQTLVARERTYSSGSHGYATYDCLTDDRLQCAYLDAVQWILKMRAIFGFRFQTAYLSVTYLYRFLLRRQVDQRGKGWAIRLLSVACLSLAVKMEECKIPALSEFRVDDYNFENGVIQRMEIMVLNTLEWRMSFVTPYAYLNYFISKFSDESRPKSLLYRTIELISDTVKVVNLMNYRPSAIAAAAVLVSFDQKLTKRLIDYKMGAVSLCGYLENIALFIIISAYQDHVFACYNLMLEFEKRKMKTPSFEVSPDLSSIYASSVHNLDTTSFISLSMLDGQRRDADVFESPARSPPPLPLGRLRPRRRLPEDEEEVVPLSSDGGDVVVVLD